MKTAAADDDAKNEKAKQAYIISKTLLSCEI